MDIPTCFEEEIKGNWVSKLKKTFYGLKQSPRAWFGKVTKVMLDMEYKKSQCDHTLFIIHKVSGRVTTLLDCVDDIVITGTEEGEKKRGSLKELLGKGI